MIIEVTFGVPARCKPAAVEMKRMQMNHPSITRMLIHAREEDIARAVRFTAERPARRRRSFRALVSKFRTSLAHARGTGLSQAQTPARVPNITVTLPNAGGCCGGSGTC